MMMKMNLNNFESHIDKKILARGYDYYQSGCVTSVEEIDDNVYAAEVEGTELYTVEVELDDQANIIDTQCDCPYNLGEYCKHQVAVLLTLRDMQNNLSGEKSLIQKYINLYAEATHKFPDAYKSQTPDMKKILSARTKDELIEFLLDIASEYEEIRQRIALNLANGNDQDEITKSTAIIRTFISKSSDRHGYVAYEDVGEAVKGADLVLEKARSAFAQHKTTHAVGLALCVIHELIELLQDADDSDGIIGDVIDESFDFIGESIKDAALGPVDQENIFHKLLEEATNRRYDDWSEWRLDLLVHCAELADNELLRNELEKHLISMIGSDKGEPWSGNYFAEKIHLIRYRLVEKIDGFQKAREFIEQNLQHTKFREMAIESAMQKKDYDYVIKLTLAGEEKDKSLPGLVGKWKQYRFKAYQLAGKLDEQRGIALDFILDGSFEYYQELKNTYDEKDWPSIYPRIIFLLESQKKTFWTVYTSILIEEGEKQKLLEYVKGRLSAVESFYKYLIPEFKEEVYELFQQYIEQTAARAGNRKDYQGVCAIIRSLKKAGGQEQARQIKQSLYAKYANRPAFRDELTRV